MDNDGKLVDVLIEEFSYRDDMGFPKFCNLVVWADAGSEELIASVPGVTNVYHCTCDTQFDVFLDPRYDREWVKAEIEARIKIGAPNGQ